MVIDMNEAQVRTLAQVRQVLAGTQAMEFQAAADDAGRYAWLESVLRRFEYRGLPRADRGPVLAYLQRLSGYSRSQITRLVSRLGQRPAAGQKLRRAPLPVCPPVHTDRRGAAGRCGPRHGHAVRPGHSMRAAPPA